MFGPLMGMTQRSCPAAAISAGGSSVIAAKDKECVQVDFGAVLTDVRLKRLFGLRGEAHNLDFGQKIKHDNKHYHA